MRRLALAFAFGLLACRGEEHAAPPRIEAGAADAADAAPPAELDDPTVKARSRAVLEAYDRNDEAAFAPQLARSFVLFEARRVFDRDFVTRRMSKRRERRERSPSRSYADENVHLGPTSAVYIVDSSEHFPANGEGHPEHDYDGWNTLVWVKEGAEWRLASWQIANGGLAADREEWNGTYRERPNFDTKPNRLLVDTLVDRGPGRALDLMMGQGRNAVYLASKGWTTTGVDLSDEGVRIAREAAAKQKLKLEAVVADVTKWDIGTARWDLITMIYAGTDGALIERAKVGLKPGGVFVLETFSAEGERAPGVGGAAKGELAARFREGFHVLKDEVVEDEADWGTKTKLVRFVAQKK